MVIHACIQPASNQLKVHMCLDWIHFRQKRTLSALEILSPSSMGEDNFVMISITLVPKGKTVLYGLLILWVP
jgi:hypothetical protein